MITEREIERGKRALELVKRIAEFNCYDTEYEMYCYFCDARLVDNTLISEDYGRVQPHKDDCIWLQAKRLVEE